MSGAASSTDYRGEWPLLLREYQRLEADFLFLTEFVPLSDSPNAPNFQFGSPRAASFGLDCCTWIETSFKWLLRSPKWDEDAEVVRARDEDENIGLYRRLFDSRCKLADAGRMTIDTDLIVQPFQDFKGKKTPQWFADFSRPKHDRFELARLWTMMHSVQGLAGLSVVMSALVTPSMAFNVESKVFRDTRFPSHLPKGSPFW